MSTSQQGTRLIIAALSAAVIGLVIALVAVTRPTAPPTPAPDRPPEAQNPVRLTPNPGGFGQARDGAHKQPPARARNELGQPLNEDGRPIGPAEKVAGLRNKPITPGEVPLTPPLFQDPAQRAAFKSWWVGEMSRRINIYQELEPGPEYPAAKDAAHMLDALYDAAEPRRPGESVDDAWARRQTWQTLWKQFLNDYGATVHTVMSRAGDPQYGTTPPPPVDPPGVPDPGAPPATPAQDAPPGRGDSAPGTGDTTDTANPEQRAPR